MANTSTETNTRTIYLRDMEYLVGTRFYVHIIDRHHPFRVEMIDFETDTGNHRFSELAHYIVVYIIGASATGNHVEIGIYEDKSEWR